MAVSQIVSRHFNRSTLTALSRKGIIIVGITALPDTSGSFANSETGYLVDDSGTGRVWTFLEVLGAAQ